MIAKEKMFCVEKNKLVEALVEKSGKKSAPTITALNCMGSAKCEKTTFCKFVNPLTTRIPLTTPEAAEEAASV